MGGFWSAYWYRGYIYGTEIARGLDVLELTPSEHLTENEIAAAASVASPAFNASSSGASSGRRARSSRGRTSTSLARSDTLDADRRASLASLLDRVDEAGGAAAGTAPAPWRRTDGGGAGPRRRLGGRGRAHRGTASRAGGIR